MIQFIQSKIDPSIYEIVSNGDVLQEVTVLFTLRKIPRSFASSEEVLHWLKETEKKLVKNRAYRLLSMKSYASTLLQKKLEEKGYSPTLCKQIIEELKTLGYIQDNEYWQRFIQKELKKGYGPRVIEWKGKMQGMPSGLALSQITHAMEKEAIAKLKNKTPAALYRRGFHIEIIA